ncbi:MAG: TrmH family RNA methyltransferase, partial [Bacteroidota bacterium]
TGVSGRLLQLADSIVKIPMAGEIGSLNVSVAAGIMMYEVVKQRR